MNPKQQAHQTIDAMLKAAGWALHDYKTFDHSASIGMALREVPLKSDRCDYLLLANRRPFDFVGAKKEGLNRIEPRSSSMAKIICNQIGMCFNGKFYDPNYKPFNMENEGGRAYQGFDGQL